MTSMLLLMVALLFSACSAQRYNTGLIGGVVGPMVVSDGTTLDTTLDTPLTDEEAASVTDSDWQPPTDKKAAKRQAKFLRLALKKANKKNGKGLNKVAERWFNDYKRRNQKNYSPEEEQNAKQAWLDNIAEIAKQNDDDSSTSWAGLHEYSDMSPVDMTDKMMMKNKPQRGNPKRINPLDDPASAARFQEKVAKQSGSATSRKLLQTVPATDDWRQFTTMTVRNQGLCSSCWAFAATTAVEANHNYLYGVNPKLAPQQLIDCENPRTGFFSQGCLGGYSDGAFEYILKVNQTTEARYPYRGLFGSVCNATSSRIPKGTAVQNAGTEATIYPTQNDPMALMQAEWINPTVVYVHASAAFMAYKGGIFNPTSTQCDPALVNHAVVVMGYNYTGSWSTSYFIIQNSWGTTWGESGYMRIAMWPPGPGPCGMYQYPMYPALSFAQAMPPPPPPPVTYYPTYWYPYWGLAGLPSGWRAQAADRLTDLHVPVIPRRLH